MVEVDKFVEYMQDCNRLQEDYPQADGFYQTGITNDTYEFAMTFEDCSELIFALPKELFSDNYDNIDRASELLTKYENGDYEEI